MNKSNVLDSSNTERVTFMKSAQGLIYSLTSGLVSNPSHPPRQPPSSPNAQTVNNLILNSNTPSRHRPIKHGIQFDTQIIVSAPQLLFLPPNGATRPPDFKINNHKWRCPCVCSFVRFAPLASGAVTRPKYPATIYISNKITEPEQKER